MKNLKVVCIDSEQKVHISSLWAILNPYALFAGWISESDTPFYAESSSKKRVPINTGQLYYEEEYLGKRDIILPGTMAKELGVTVGDKISIKVTLSGKLGPDYLVMYEKNPKKFIKYFEQQSVCGKKNILRELLGLDATNEKVVDWLNKNYPDLIREVGLE